MRRTCGLFPVVLMLSVTALATSAQAAPRVSITMEMAILAKMNAARTTNGLPALKTSKVLRGSARTHSRYLLTTGTFTHDGPGGAPFWKRLVAAGFPKTKTMGENLAVMEGCPKTAARIVELWMNSPPHRRNLLSTRFNVVGVGIVSGGTCGKAVYTTDFGG